ncbi:MAG: monofunctional biosynthetic peptidoglycan transglycosylase [Candidatus Symbiothrix sp.]|jgi:monofunctional biosynthetic peptidoglycan transglycosylase|nr:monofunctional biosynthetic peptidoglycan transglycosylase [Candidatus Symbiothrix sp.]
MKQSPNRYAGKDKKKIHWFKKIWHWIRNISLTLFVLSLFSVLLFKYVPVYYTPLMLIRSVEQVKAGKKIHIAHRWIPLSEISQNLVQAVVASEDNLFLVHDGFSFEQIELARREAAQGKRARGASTISQQTAKNVFLTPNRSWIRKGLEAYFTILIEFVWGKERIMEVYLNSIEMGDGIFGAQAVSASHFHKPASKLTIAEAALIAATLPNPQKYNSAKPSAYMLKRQAKITSLMPKIIRVDFDKTTIEKHKEYGKKLKLKKKKK